VLPRGACRVKEGTVSLSLLSVLPSIFSAEIPLIALNWLKGAIWDTISQQRGGGTKQTVAALDVPLEKRKWFSRFNCFHPQIDLAELDGHGVEVYAVDTATNDVAQGLAPRFRWRLFLTNANGGQFPGDAMGCGNEEVPTATGGITNFETEDGFLWIGLATGFIEDRV
jgi:hypothetical protein